MQLPHILTVLALAMSAATTGAQQVTTTDPSFYDRSATLSSDATIHWSCDGIYITMLVVAKTSAYVGIGFAGTQSISVVLHQVPLNSAL